MTADPLTDYRTLSQAFAYLNAELFAGQLPACLITLQREKHVRGYYAHEAYASRTEDGAAISEIALNPETFAGRTDLEILSTLAHEMCHLWQAYSGKPSRNGYHNAQWGAKMREIGLEPRAADGSGKPTGQRVTHDIIPGGRFEHLAGPTLTPGQALAGARLHWQSRTIGGDETAAKKRASKTKYTCPDCGQNAWAKPEAALMCARCEELMLAEVEEGPADA